MRKFLCSLTLFGAVGVLAASAPAPSPARAEDDKKDAKKDEKDIKKDEKKTDAGAIEVYQASDGWRFRVRDAEGKSLAIGTQGFAKKEDCVAAVDQLKMILAKAKVAEVGK
jgi:uncharacterized protein YegP (UPF0339 family)